MAMATFFFISLEMDTGNWYAHVSANSMPFIYLPSSRCLVAAESLILVAVLTTGYRQASTIAPTSGVRFCAKNHFCFSWHAGLLAGWLAGRLNWVSIATKNRVGYLNVIHTVASTKHVSPEKYTRRMFFAFSFCSCSNTLHSFQPLRLSSFPWHWSRPNLVVSCRFLYLSPLPW